MKPNEIIHSLVRDSKGIYYYFYINNNNGIECNVYDENGLFTEGFVILKKGVINFSAVVNADDDIHLIIINNTGNIVDFLYSNKRWSMKNIHNIDIKNKHCKYLKIFSHNGYLDIYLGLLTSFPYETWTIDHIKYIDEKKSLTRILTSRNQGAIGNFYIDYDNKNNIHILFKNLDLKNYQIFYNIHNPYTNSWGKVITKLSESRSNTIDSYMFSDSNSVIHTAWTVINNDSISLRYKRKDPFTNDEDKWSFYSLPREFGNISHPIIFNDNGYLRMLYVKDNALRGFYSHNSGYSWNTDKFFNDFSINDFTLIPYSSNYMFNNGESKFKDIYGKITDKYILLYDGNIEEKINLLNNLLSSKSEHDDLLPNEDESESLETTYHQEEINEDNKSCEKSNDTENKDWDIFFLSINKGLDTILSDLEYTSDIKGDIEKLINENISHINANISSPSNNVEDFLIKLQDIEKHLKDYKIENQKVLELLTLIKDTYIENSKNIAVMEEEINKIKEEAKEYKNQNILSKFKNIFK